MSRDPIPKRRYNIMLHVFVTIDCLYMSVVVSITSNSDHCVSTANFNQITIISWSLSWSSWYEMH